MSDMMPELMSEHIPIQGSGQHTFAGASMTTQSADDRLVGHSPQSSPLSAVAAKEQDISSLDALAFDLRIALKWVG